MPLPTAKPLLSLSSQGRNLDSARPLKNVLDLATVIGRFQRQNIFLLYFSRVLVRGMLTPQHPNILTS